MATVDESMVRVGRGVKAEEYKRRME